MRSHQSVRPGDSAGVEEMEPEHFSDWVAPEWNANYRLLLYIAPDAMRPTVKALTEAHFKYFRNLPNHILLPQTEGH